MKKSDICKRICGRDFGSGCNCWRVDGYKLGMSDTIFSIVDFIKHEYHEQDNIEKVLNFVNQLKEVEE